MDTSADKSISGTKPPLFSVVIPFFANPAYLLECLASVQQQSCNDFELIIVDDGSPTGLSDLIDEVSLDVNLSIIAQENQGATGARNSGASQASGDYLFFLDSDDVLLPWALKSLKDAIQSNGNPSVVAGNAIQFSETIPRIAAPTEPIKTELYENYFATYKEALWLLTGATVVKTAHFNQIGGYIKKRINAEDTDLWIRLGTAPKFTSIQNPPLLLYRQHLSSAIRDHNKTLEGVTNLVDSEHYGFYPGGRKFKRQRAFIISSHTRPAILSTLQNKLLGKSLSLYAKSFRINLRANCFRFLLGFWVLFAFYCFRFAPEILRNKKNC